jgi:hypothetical protein
MYGGNVETIAINEIDKVFVSICFVHDQTTQPLTIILVNITVSQVVTKRNVYSFVV